MKKYSLYKLLCLFVGMFSISACSDKDDPFVLRSTDTIEFSYAESTKEFTVCTNGDWSITTDDSWYTLSTVSGNGDGTTREVVKVNVARNKGAARQGEFVLHAAGKDLNVSISQEEGKPLKLNAPSLSSSLKVGQKIENMTISIPYTYGYAGQNVVFTTTVSGTGASGITVNSYTAKFNAAEGTIKIPVTGTPLASGSVLFTITTDDQSVTSVTATATVLSETYLEQHFGLMLWGGDCVANIAGIKGGFISGSDGSVIDPAIAVSACTAGSDGSSDLTSTMAPSYRELRGFSGWTGKRVYERPGFVKIGTSTSTDGQLISPPLSNISLNKVNLNVSLKVSQYFEDTGGTLYITVLNGGTSSISEYKMRPGTDRIWESVEFKITDATPASQIVFSAPSVTKQRFCIDDIVVSRAN